MTNRIVNRRAVLKTAGLVGGAAAFSSCFPAWAHDATGLTPPMESVSGEEIALKLAHATFGLNGKAGHALTVNGTMPGPIIRLKEGQSVRLAVTNNLAEDSSIHWHGILLPFNMDGVPGISFPGIKPGQTYNYDFKVRQAGTYWYHSHSNMQDAMGMFGAIIVDPAKPDPVRYDREHVIILSDWGAMHPHAMLKKLKIEGAYFNRQKQTLAGLAKGKDQSLSDRLMWGAMRMDPTDISDVSAPAYTYLINGHDSAANWTGLFTKGEHVRLRIINASSMSNFNVRIPGLPMTVVQADGLNVRPVEVDEFQIGIAETYDVIVTPPAEQAYGFIAEAINRSGLCRATLAPRLGMVASVPSLRERPLLGMKDMGMSMGSMAGMDHGDMAGMDHSKMNHGDMKMDHGAMNMKMRDPSAAPQVKMGPGVATLSPDAEDRSGDRPTGLESVDHRVLTYRQLVALEPNADSRVPNRELDIHLTANMERYMWSFDGVKFSDRAEPLAFRQNERVRVNLINHTMMPHPIHMHGHFFELVNGNPGNQPSKHTVNVLPGGKISFDLTADALGDWAFHCHMLFHMHTGMFRVVTVRKDDDQA
jgi:CopA family copper-resistance protein